MESGREAETEEEWTFKQSRGFPRPVWEGGAGTMITAPPLPIGLEAIFSPMIPNHWLLTIQVAPPPRSYEARSMVHGTEIID